MPNDGLSILLVEDDARLSEFVAEYLECHGVIVQRAVDGPTAVREALASDFDAVVLDWLLPGMQGADVCRAIRQRKDVPVLIITARQEEADRVLGLELGADDFILKPFSLRELLARIRANVRRARGAMHEGRTITVGELRLFIDGKQCQVGSVRIDLTSSEFDLLQVLAERRNHVLSREALLIAMKGDASLVFDRAIDVLVHRIRSKIETNPSRPQYLKTIRGAGYMLCEPR